MLAFHGPKHLPRHAAIAEVAGRAGAQFGDVLGFGKIHLEEAANARGQWQQIESRLRSLRSIARRDLCAGDVRGFDRGLVVGQDSSFGQNIVHRRQDRRSQASRSRGAR